jgi:hypothetical protein
MMFTPRLLIAPLTVAGLLWSSLPVQAGWNNVFLVSCNDCGPIRRAFSPTQPQQQRDVQYEQRCYYEPVKVMRPERYTEEVPVQVKSYYWDPVTSYSYRSYYDPCSNSCQQIAVPRTSYVRKEKCETVMKAVERVRMVPVEVARKVCETRPVVTYYGPVTKSYGPYEPIAGGSGTDTLPRVDELRGIQPNVMPGERISPPNVPVTPQEMGSQKISPAVKNNPKINAFSTSLSPEKTRIIGEVLGSDQQTPKPGAKIVFVNAANHEIREYATADAYGNFELTLQPGEWHLYVGKGDGQAHYYKKLTIAEGQARNFAVVSK